MPKIAVFILVTCIYNLASAQCRLQDKETKKEFKIYNAFLYDNMPSMRALCVDEINVMYAWEFYPRGPALSKGRQPEQKDIERAATKISARNILTVIDIEHWELKHTDRGTIAKSAENYNNLIQAVTRLTPGVPIGYYGVVPIIDFSRAKMPRDSYLYKTWVNDNTLLFPIGKSISATFPSLYTINSSQSDWLSSAEAQLKEARRIAAGKPVYPFIWPNYHDQGGRIPEGTFVPVKFWRTQLEFLRTSADGIVLWGGNKQTLNQDWPWWKELVSFINEKFVRID